MTVNKSFWDNPKEKLVNHLNMIFKKYLNKYIIFVYLSTFKVFYSSNVVNIMVFIFAFKWHK